MSRPAWFAASAGVLVLAALVLFGRAPRSDRLPEDDLAVWSNPAVTGPSIAGALLGRFYDSQRDGFRPAVRPVAVFWHQLEHRLFGENRAGYIWIRILLAVGAALAFFQVLQTFGTGPPAALFGSLILLAHPLTAASVLTVAGASDLLALLFVLLAVLAVRRLSGRGDAPPFGRSGGESGETGNRSPGGTPAPDPVYRAALAGFLVLVAAWSKEIALAAVPALLALWWVSRRGQNGRLEPASAPADPRRPGAAGFGVGLAIGGATVLVLAHRVLSLSLLPAHLKLGKAVESATGLDLARRVWVGLTGIGEAVRLMLLPVRVPYSADYLAVAPSAAFIAPLGLLALAGLAVLAVRAWRRRDPAVFWATWGFFALLGASGILFSNGSITPPRLMAAALPPALGIVLGLIAGSRARGRSRAWRIVGAALGVVLVVLCAARTIDRTRDYRTREALFTAQTVEFPESAQAWFDLGNVALTRGDFATAITRYEKATDLQPEYWAAWTNMGSAFTSRQEPGLAMRAFDRVLAGVTGRKAFRVIEARANFNRALVLLMQARNVEAAEGFENMLAVFPDHLVSHANLGLIYSNDESLDERATSHLNRALEMETNPDRRKLLLDFLEGIQKRRARLDRERLDAPPPIPFDEDLPAGSGDSSEPGGSSPEPSDGQPGSPDTGF